MTTEKSLIDSALRGWKFNVERADKLFGGLIAGRQLEHGAGRIGAAKGIVNVLLGTERRDIPPLRSQPSLSRQIRDLEDDAGTQLPKSLHAGSDSELDGELFQ